MHPLIYQHWGNVGIVPVICDVKVWMVAFRFGDLCSFVDEVNGCMK